MKEIPFRWIDKYLIHLTLQEKFYLLFFLPLIAVLTTFGVLSFAADNMAADIATRSANELANLANNPDVSLLSYLSTTQVVLLSVVFFILALGVYYVMTFIGGAMFSTNKAITTLVDGDLTNRLNYFPVRDEFSVIAINIDKVAAREQSLVQAMQESVALMQQISSELNLSSDSSFSISNQQHANLDSLASATEQMATTIREVANLAHDSSVQTNDARSVAQSGQSKVSETLGAISELSNEIQSAAAAVAELDQNATQIDEVVSTINGISEQTNLLALNAAIEAARAGEQGRGFAVVADEVRTLAGRTQQATVEIQTMIEALQRNSSSLTKLMETTVENAGSGQVLMNEVDHQIGDLADKNQFISESSTQIATAAEQQGVVADSIAESVENVRNQSIQVNDMIQSSKGNIDKLRTQSDDMEKLLTGLKA
ncbi:methyl-accepting chemotaxis protein [Vibrio sp. SCSIO 43136]|uniref:methyl-accepting chemotaxis protein n=1 Tax=Vibrio sp. SCSIO 43136 TaxID=2819101 RepID=UPI0020760521|nr:methyl-accepting chemotaxis protein [Vibrio sp. SCSIO 43136]USD64004.1 methyl-accepting chemotaxis protein [Vibrio sp. SCSIO 43136]